MNTDALTARIEVLENLVIALVGHLQAEGLVSDEGLRGVLDSLLEHSREDAGEAHFAERLDTVLTGRGVLPATPFEAEAALRATIARHKRLFPGD